MDQKAYWVGFNLVKGIGSVRLQGLLDFYGSAEIAWSAPSEGLRAAGLPPKVLENFLQIRRQVDLVRIWDKITSQCIQVLTWNDADYPRRLKEIDQPPPTLYVRGSLLPEDQLAIAIVGTRRITVYGRQVAEDTATILAQNAVTVVSGLARGVDAAAHQAALKAGGRTIAVLGSGVDRIYPPENRKLAEQITENGAVISDYAPGTPPDSLNFPPRNRIISGLSIATLVVEAGTESGALITATYAAEQGREVFAVPGNINAPQSRGANRLIRDGARPLLHPMDLLEALELEHVQQHVQAQILFPADEVETKILGIIQNEPVHVDEIRARTDLPIEKVSATLSLMELKGIVRQVGGMNYIAAHETKAEYWTE
jgi:DNA processing protein